MINSLISNMTALAVAAVQVADSDQTISGEVTLSPECELESGEVGPQVEKIVEKIDSFAQQLEDRTIQSPSLVDQSAIEKAAKFIDSCMLSFLVLDICHMFLFKVLTQTFLSKLPFMFWLC